MAAKYFVFAVPLPQMNRSKKQKQQLDKNSAATHRFFSTDVAHFSENAQLGACDPIQELLPPEVHRHLHVLLQLVLRNGPPLG